MVYDFIFISNSFILESKGFLIVGGYGRGKKELDLIDLVERKWSMNEAVKFLEGFKVRKRVRYLNFKTQVGIIWGGKKKKKKSPWGDLPDGDKPWDQLGWGSACYSYCLRRWSKWQY